MKRLVVAPGMERSFRDTVEPRHSFDHDADATELEDELDEQIPGKHTLTERLAPVDDSSLVRPIPSPHWRRIDRAGEGAGYELAPDSELTELVTAARSNAGTLLPAELLARLATLLDADLAGVRVHVDDAASVAARALSARAFTIEQDIFFASGQYDPTSPAGRRLIAHEVAHTVQQASGVATAGHATRVSGSSDPSEHAAEAFAERFTSPSPTAGGAAAATHANHGRVGNQVPALGHVGAAIVQRETEPGAQRVGARPQDPHAQQSAAWDERRVRELVRRGPPTRVFEEIAARDTANGLAILSSTPLWATVLMHHPRGSEVPAPTRAAMYSMVHRGLLDEDRYRQLFWTRFDVRFERVYNQDALNRGDRQTPASMPAWNQLTADRIWWQLDRLPDQDVSENSALEVVRTTVRSSNAGEYHDASPGQHPSNRNVAVMTERTVTNTGARPDGTLGQTDEEAGIRTELTLEDTVRHEIGHAVHARLRSAADPWLAGDVQFTVEPVSAANIEALIGRLGGFPAAMGEAQRQQVLQMICDWARAARGWPAGGFGAGETGTPAEQELMRQLPRVVQELGSFRDADGGWPSDYPETTLGREFLNQHYGTVNRLGARGYAMIEATGRRRAGYAPQEFFAECYAEYYGDPAAARDPARRGGSLPASVKTWFDAHVAAHPPRAGAEPDAEAGDRAPGRQR